MSFLVGVITGISVMVFVNMESDAPASESPTEAAPVLTSAAAARIPDELMPPPHISGQPNAPPAASVQPPQPNVEPKLPDTYREAIGPPRRRLTFSERLQNFESEPRDDSWALPMEAGINNFTAIHGAEFGAVFEFVQCRSNWCLVAGYFLPGYPDETSVIMSPMKNETWWQGGNYTSTHGGKLGDNESFVTLLSRYDVQP